MIGISWPGMLQSYISGVILFVEAVRAMGKGCQVKGKARARMPEHDEGNREAVSCHIMTPNAVMGAKFRSRSRT